MRDAGGPRRHRPLGHLRRPVYREVLEQTPLVRRGRRDREGDARVSAEIPQLPLIRQCRQDDLIPLDPTQAAVTCGPPSSSIVTTCATASLSRSSRAVSGRGIPAIGGCYPVRIDASDGYQAAAATAPAQPCDEGLVPHRRETTAHKANRLIEHYAVVPDAPTGHDLRSDPDKASGFGWGIAFSLLAIGPVIGVAQMLRLKRDRALAV